MKATATAFVLVLAGFRAALAAPDEKPNQFKLSTTIETDRPELDEDNGKRSPHIRIRPSRIGRP